MTTGICCERRLGRKANDMRVISQLPAQVEKAKEVAVSQKKVLTNGNFAGWCVCMKQRPVLIWIHILIQVNGFPKANFVVSNEKQLTMTFFGFSSGHSSYVDP